jgi:ubiquinone/menaquinone biosynthesis C-methylase UbiE
MICAPTRTPIEYKGLSFFDLPKALYGSLVEGMTDENKWHFRENNTESHMAFLKEWGPRMVKWADDLRFPKGSVHLDLGAGEGILSYLVARRGYCSIAVELSATILHSATVFRAGLDRESPNDESTMRLWIANIYDLPLATASVDFVTIKQVIHHLEDVDGLMNEVSRVLKPDGVAYILWEPFYTSIPILRQREVERERARELPMGIHHVYHTYGTYKRIFGRWLVSPKIETEYQIKKPRHYLTRNRFTRGIISASGHAKPHQQSTRGALEQIQIKPQDFLCDELLDQGLKTTLCRKSYLDSLART